MWITTFWASDGQSLFHYWFQISMIKKRSDWHRIFFVFRLPHSPDQPLRSFLLLLLPIICSVVYERTSNWLSIELGREKESLISTLTAPSNRLISSCCMHACMHGAPNNCCMPSNDEQTRYLSSQESFLPERVFRPSVDSFGLTAWNYLHSSPAAAATAPPSSVLCVRW